MTAKFSAHFGVVNVDGDCRRSLNRIHEGVSRAKFFLRSQGRAARAESLSLFESRYTKALLEGSRVSQAIDIAERSRVKGWQVALVCLASSESLFQCQRSGQILPLSLQKLDEDMHGDFSKVMPPLTTVSDKLKAAFGDGFADYTSTKGIPADREAARDAFQRGKSCVLYATYGAGKIYVTFRDECGDRPRVSVFLGLPYGAAMLEQAIRLTWGTEVRSDTHAVFLTTHSDFDVHLLTTRTGPTIHALGGSVRGIVGSATMTSNDGLNKNHESGYQGQAADDQQDGISVDAQSFHERANYDVRIDDWKAIDISGVQGAKHTWLQNPSYHSNRSVTGKPDLLKLKEIAPRLPLRALTARQFVDQVSSRLRQEAKVPSRYPLPNAQQVHAGPLADRENLEVASKVVVPEIKRNAEVETESAPAVLSAARVGETATLLALPNLASMTIVPFHRDLGLLACSVVLLVVAFTRWPYFFYILLRFVVCAVSTNYSLSIFRQGRRFWVWVFGAIAVLFNPLLPIRMGRSDWQVLNVLVAAFFIAWSIIRQVRHAR